MIDLSIHVRECVPTPAAIHGRIQACLEDIKKKKLELHELNCQLDLLEIALASVLAWKDEYPEGDKWATEIKHNRERIINALEEAGAI